MKSAFLFPGQGAQFVGMGADVYEAYPEARARFEQADAILGFPLTQVMFGAGTDPEAEAEALRQTEITQPALYLHSMAVMAVLETHTLRPNMTAGHSLGEYSALTAAGALSFEDGLKMVRLRGMLMSKAGTERQGTMAAVLGMDDTDTENLCLKASEAGEGIVQAANFNAPGQIVISGDVVAVERAMAMAPEHGARRVIPLAVSGAFHSPLMEHARAGLAEALETFSIQVPHCPVYLNVSAQATTDPETIRSALLAQLTAPVCWSQTLTQMQKDGATRFLEVGAGKVLSGLVKRTLGRRTETEQAGTAENVVKLTAQSST